MGVKFSIAVPAEFNFSSCYDFLCRSPKELLHRCEGNKVTKLVRVDDSKVLIRVSEMRDKSLLVEVLNGPLTNGEKEAVRLYVRSWFDLDTDLKPFYQMAARDKMLKQLTKEYFGYRIVGQPDLFESLVWAVLGQQINVSFAYTLKQRFVQQYGERLTLDGITYYLFPTAASVSTIEEHELLELQFSRQKSRYTIAIGKAFVEGSVSQERLRTLSVEAAKEELMRIKGVGNWTANYALMKTFRFPDAYPREDAGIHNAIRRLMKMDRKPTLAEVDAVYGPYAGWEAYATLYLWKSL